MALSAKSLFTYGLEVTTLNNKLDFQIVALGATLTATLNIGFYSPESLAEQVALQIQTMDSVNIYSVTVDRSILGGTQNRLTIATSGSYLSLLFATGPNYNISCASLIGFNPSDYVGSTFYTGSSSMGSSLIPDYIAYNYLDSQHMSKLFGAVNVAASGLKEAITFNTQFFITLDYKYEKKANLSYWQALFIWAIQQRPFDFTPEITNPTYFFTVTLDSTQYEQQGLGYQMNEMLPDFPNFYETGPLKFRINPSTGNFA